MQITINDKVYDCTEKETILLVAKRNNIQIPAICYDEDFKPQGKCRMCLVELNGKLVTSCNTPVKEGMIVYTDTEKVKKVRKTVIELTASRDKETFCGLENHELNKIMAQTGVREIRFKPKEKDKKNKEGVGVKINHKKCILCGKCVLACERQTINAIALSNRGIHSEVTTYFDHNLSDTYCILCGQCTLKCPVNAISEQENINDVLEALNSKKKVYVQTAPSIRVSLGEEFGAKPGTLVTGKMVSALRKVGFDKVFDTNFGADITTIEESNEFINRYKEKKNLPILTSCCPSWVKFIEHNYPEYIKNLSTGKSPETMLGAIIKNFYDKNCIIVSIMPCTSKKFEIIRNKKNDVDFVLTTRELAKLIKIKKIDFNSLPDEEFDKPFGESSGASALYGSTSGVSESALRTAYNIITGKELKDVDVTQIRGLDGIKRKEITIGENKIKIAIVNGINNARTVLQELKSGCHYDLIEVMACPGGCIGGGGQPKPTTKEIVVERAKAIYAQDKNHAIRKAHLNKSVQKVYDSYLGKPLGKKSEKLLHTSYKKRTKF